jgi:hypothetical protein
MRTLAAGDERCHVRHALVAGEVVHVDDDGTGVGLDDVEPVQAQAERPTRRQRNAAQLVAHRRRPAGEREAHLGERLADGEHLIADDIDLDVLVAAVDVLLREHRRLRARDGGQLARVADDGDAGAPVTAVGLHDERRLRRDARQQAQIAGDPGARRWDAGGAQTARGDDLVLRRRARAVRVQHPRALGVEHAGDAERELGVRLQDVQVVLDSEPIRAEDGLLDDRRLDLVPATPEDLEDVEQDRALDRGHPTDEQEGDLHGAAAASRRAVIPPAPAAARTAASQM